MSLKGLSRAIRRPVLPARVDEAALEFSSEPIQSQSSAPPPIPVRHGAAVLPLPRVCPGAPFIVSGRTSSGSPSQTYDVYIYGVIGTESMQGAANISDVIQLLDTADEKTTFTFHVCSGGGSVHEAAQLGSAMRKTKARTIAIAEGPVCSAAVTVWMSAREQRAEDGAYFMQHMSMHPDGGNSVAVATMAAALVRFVCDTTLDPMREKGLVTQAEYEAIVDLRREVWISAGEMQRRLAVLHAKEASNANR